MNKNSNIDLGKECFLVWPQMSDLGLNNKNENFILGVD